MAQLAKDVAGAFVISQHKAGLVRAACGTESLNLIEFGRLAAAHHDFTRHDDQFLLLDPEIFGIASTDETTGPEVESDECIEPNHFFALLSKTLDDDLALCVVCSDRLILEAQSVLNVVVARYRAAMTGSAFDPAPPAPSGGQGASSYAGFAAYSPRRRGGDN